MALFWSSALASATIVSDAKFDDALFLRLFLLQNLRRPVEHEVEVRVLIVGVRDTTSAASMLQHVAQITYDEAQKRYGRQLPLVNVEVLVSATQLQPVRHERLCYEPYVSGKFPAHTAPFWQRPAPSQFVFVIGPFFRAELFVKGEDGFEFHSERLDHLVPVRGGQLAFQFGFNTNVPGNRDQEVWQALQEKVAAAGAGVVLVNNVFSFTGSPGKMDVADPFLQQLRRSHPLWEHLLGAARAECWAFSADQMASWLALEPRGDRDYSSRREGLMQLARAQQLSGDRASMGAELLRRSREDLPSAQRLCDQLYALVGEGRHSEYLKRAGQNLRSSDVEITDAVHGLTLPRQELFPVQLTFTPAGAQVQFDASGDLIRAVRGVDPAEAKAHLQLTAPALSFEGRAW